MGILIQDETTRKAVDGQVTIGDLCMDSLKDMFEDNSDTQRFTVLHKGAIYFFDITCAGIKPPYEMQGDADGPGALWFGQRPC